MPKKSKSHMFIEYFLSVRHCRAQRPWRHFATKTPFAKNLLWDCSTSLRRAGARAGKRKWRWKRAFVNIGSGWPRSRRIPANTKQVFGRRRRQKPQSGSGRLAASKQRPLWDSKMSLSSKSNICALATNFGIRKRKKARRVSLTDLRLGVGLQRLDGGF